MFESYQRVLGGCISKRVSVRKALTGFASVVLLWSCVYFNVIFCFAPGFIVPLVFLVNQFLIVSRCVLFTNQPPYICVSIVWSSVVVSWICTCSFFLFFFFFLWLCLFSFFGLLLLLHQIAHGSPCLPIPCLADLLQNDWPKKDPVVRLIRLHQGGCTLEDHKTFWILHILQTSQISF